MPVYNAPVRDTRYVLEHIVEMPESGNLRALPMQLRT